MIVSIKSHMAQSFENSWSIFLQLQCFARGSVYAVNWSNWLDLTHILMHCNVVILEIIYIYYYVTIENKENDEYVCIKYRKLRKRLRNFHPSGNKTKQIVKQFSKVPFHSFRLFLLSYMKRWGDNLCFVMLFWTLEKVWICEVVVCHSKCKISHQQT